MDSSQTEGLERLYQKGRFFVVKDGPLYLVCEETRLGVKIHDSPCLVSDAWQKMNHLANPMVTK